MMRIDFAELERALLAPRKPPWDLGDRIPSAVAVPLVDAASGTEVWIIRRPDGMRHHARELAFPGGKADPSDASLLDTALRELREELGIDRARSLGALAPMPVATSRFAIHPFAIAIDPGAKVELAASEVAELVRTPLSSFFDGTIEYSIVDMGTYRSPIFEFPPGKMFGASAHILQELLQTCATIVGSELPRAKIAETAPWLT